MLTGPADTIKKARALRRALSLPEVLLWRELRKRPGGMKFRRQHPAGRYVLDFTCLDARLAIEVDGGSHDFAARAERDEERDVWLNQQGFETLRIPAKAVFDDLEGVVLHIVDRCRPHHHAAHGPPPRSGEE